MRETLAIIGSHPRTREDFDFNRDVDVWLFNEAISNKDNKWAKRADAIFQMHVPVIWKNPQNRNDPQHYEWLKTQTEVPIIYMQEKYEEVPAAVRFPIEEVKDLTGDGAHFLSSSVSLAMGLAVLHEYKRVEVYGVAMETNTEYGFQREGVTFWLGFLRGRGVDVYFADNTFDCPIYGYEGEVAIPYERIEIRVAELEPLIGKLDGEYRAKHLDLKNTVIQFEDGGAATVEEKLYKCVEVTRDSAMRLGEVDGALQENLRYKNKADAMRVAAGDFIFSRQEFEAAAKTHMDAKDQAVIAMNAIGVNLASIHKGIMGAAKGSKKRADLCKVYRNALDQYMIACNKIAIHNGAATENFSYMSQLDKGIRAAGGSKSEEVLLEVLLKELQNGGMVEAVPTGTN